MPALRRLKEAVEYKAERTGSLTAIDGRTLRVRSKHSALNLLLQSAGAIVMKEATCQIHSDIRKAARDRGDQRSLYKDVRQVAHIHDEIQLEVPESIAQDIGVLAVSAMEQAGRTLGFRCPLTGEYRVGENWKETH
jgi:DNA polymerase I-like protein with 3'-5' exonuclease and polymerase domains